MATLTVRNLDELTKQTLRVRAAQHGISMEEEARRILRDALLPVTAPAEHGFGQRLRERFSKVASEDFAAPARRPARSAPSWD